MITVYEFHDIANLYPMAMPDEFELLKNSIKDKGQESPIVIYDGKILDGRNRYKACLDLSIEPIIKEFVGSVEEATNYSIELNSGRRNLDKSQKAMIGAYFIEKSRLAGTNKFTISQVARFYGTSERYVKSALTILNTDERIAQQVFDGIETITRATKRIEEISGKYEEVNRIVNDVASENLDFNEHTDTLNFLYGLEKKELVAIIIKNGYLDKKVH